MKHILIVITLIASLLAAGGESQRKKKDYHYNLKKFDSFRAYIDFGLGKLRSKIQLCVIEIYSSVF